MSYKLLKDVSASTLQVVINQILGTIVFLVTSFHLSKENYGELNWSFAVFTFTNTLLSLRLEQIVVKRSATEKDSSGIMTLYLFHVIITGLGFYSILLFLKFIFPSFFTDHYLLLIIGISQLLSFFSSPFKQIANGKERFDYLAIMSCASNFVRVVSLVLIIYLVGINLKWVLIVFIFSSAIELAVSYFMVTSKMKIPVNTGFKWNEYKRLLNQSMPQIGVAILAAGISRIDWIFLGLFSSREAIAEYSFAYRVYELSPFPLLIIAPVLLSRFSKLFSVSNPASFDLKKNEITMLIRAEMIVATFIPLVLNIIWTPVIDSITDNKYGAVNEHTFLILSFCVPFGYIINIFWSALFAQNHLRLILKITAITFSVIFIGDLIFIPLWGAIGAAIVYLVATITEYINYMRSSELSKIKETWRSLLSCIAIAAVSGFSAFNFFENTGWQLVWASMTFFLLLIITKQLKKNDILFVLRKFKAKKK